MLEFLKNKTAAIFLLVVIAIIAFFSFHRVTAKPGEEIVLYSQPYFFGKGEVDTVSIKESSVWTWASTKGIPVSVYPKQFNESLDDAASNDNTLLDFNTSIKLKVKEGKTGILIANYGSTWYNELIKDAYINIIRNYISRYNPFDLMSNREVCEEINIKAANDVKKHIANLSREKELPIEVIQVIVGRAIPNKLQKQEMERTAAATQAKQTQDRKLEVEKAREAVERQRAIADKAYQHELGLTTEQFIRLRAWGIIEKKDGANIDVMFNADNTTKMWNIK